MFAKLDGRLFDHAILDHENRGNAGQSGNRLFGNGHDVLIDADQDLSLGEETWLQLVSGIVDEDFNCKRARGLVYGWTDVRDLSMELFFGKRLYAEIHRLVL